MPDGLYDTDLLAWSREQAERLRRVAAGERVNDVDWEHIIGEIEDLGRSELRSAQSFIGLALLHGLKVLAWPEDSSVRHWTHEIANFLNQARRRVQPGMHQHINVAELLAEALDDIAGLAVEMGTPPAPLPHAIHLTPADFGRHGISVDRLLAALREATRPEV